MNCERKFISQRLRNEGTVLFGAGDISRLLLGIQIFETLLFKFVCSKEISEVADLLQ